MVAFTNGMSSCNTMKHLLIKVFVLPLGISRQKMTGTLYLPILSITASQEVLWNTQDIQGSMHSYPEQGTLIKAGIFRGLLLSSGHRHKKALQRRGRMGWMIWTRVYPSIQLFVQMLSQFDAFMIDPTSILHPPSSALCPPSSDCSANCRLPTANCRLVWLAINRKSSNRKLSSIFPYICVS